MAVTGVEGFVLVVARVLFGGVLAFMGVNHFLQREQMTGYAAYKGVPAPGLSVVVSGAVLVLGGVGIVVGVFPLVSGLLVAGFLVISAGMMHNFWAVDGEDQQTEMTQFLKNIVIAGGALAFASIASQSWAYSLGIGF